MADRETPQKFAVEIQFSEKGKITAFIESESAQKAQKEASEMCQRMRGIKYVVSEDLLSKP